MNLEPKYIANGNFAKVKKLWQSFNYKELT